MEAEREERRRAMVEVCVEMYMCTRSFRVLHGVRVYICFSTVRGEKKETRVLSPQSFLLFSFSPAPNDPVLLSCISNYLYCMYMIYT
jgi:hypothetical protein